MNYLEIKIKKIIGWVLLATGLGFGILFSYSEMSMTEKISDRVSKNPSDELISSIPKLIESFQGITTLLYASLLFAVIGAILLINPLKGDQVNK